MFAEIAFPISSYQTFTYSIPAKFESQVCTGVRVRAPLGKRNVQGIVVSTIEKSNYPGKIKSISGVIDTQAVLDDNLWKLIQWMSQYYFTPIGQVARTVLPTRLSASYEPRKKWRVEPIEQQVDWSLVRHAPAQTQLLKSILSKGSSSSLSEYGEMVSSPLTVCKALAKKGLIRLVDSIDIPDTTGFTFKPIPKTIKFSEIQKQVLSEINTGISNSGYTPHLLHGVTGSGKTEIYIAAAEHALEQGKSVIVLLPEISLTPQIGGRFRSAFGESVGLWHSKMSPALRAWTWKRMCSGDFKVIVGARSAIFSPLKNLGLIIVDEEQEPTFKQESPAPRYHARDVALVRATFSNATVLLASATPSLESYYNQTHKKLKYLSLPERYGGAVYPHVHVVDMKSEIEESGKTGQIFSGLLLEKIEDRLNKDEQCIILHNRRGYAPVLHCFSCGEILMCPHCHVALTYHKTHGGLQCHSCGYLQRIIPDQCPSCQGESLRLAGMGTQKIEELLASTFPGIQVLRLDQDTATSTKKLTGILEDFSSGKGNILLGTQMIAKGLDFAKVTLAGIVNADMGLMLPDFRSGERVFQLIYQTAGRTGRREKPGEVVIQTYNQDNPVIKHASQLHVRNYYNIALGERQELNYPPFSWIIKIEFSGKDLDKLLKASQRFKAGIRPQRSGIEILGPALCYRERLRGRFRSQIVFKSSKDKDPNGTVLRRLFSSTVLPKLQTFRKGGLMIHLDVDPVSLM